MENASKALIMAGGVLISIVIISLFLLMANSLTSYQQSNLQDQREAQITQFNQQYEAYNRKGVRGNELYSLVSKVIDYNLRKSDVSPDGTDKFQAMEIKIDLNGKNKTLTRLSNNVLFTENSYTFNDSSTTLKDISTMSEINDVVTQDIRGYSNNDKIKNNSKKIQWPTGSLDRLVTGYDKIFLSDDDFNNRLSEEEKIQTFYNVNSSLGIDDFFVIEYDNRGNLSTNLGDIRNLIMTKIKPNIDIYYEYVQFKRGIFDCVANSVKYSSSGRITSMTFKFTGEFN